MLKNKDICRIKCVNEENVKQAKKAMIKDGSILRLSETFKILGDSTRIKILHALSKQELCVCDLATLLDMTESAISHQLRLLRNFRLVKFRKEGKIVYYSLKDMHIVKLFNEGLKHAEE